MVLPQDDIELLMQFKNEATKERAFTAILKKYQEKLYWHIRRMVVEHEEITTCGTTFTGKTKGSF